MFLSNSIQFLLVAQQRIEPIQFVVETSEPAGVSRSLVISILAVVGVVIAIAVVAVFRRVTPGVINNGNLLFVELCRAYHLSRRQRKLLLEIAQDKKAACPSQVFLDINLWASEPEQPQPNFDAKVQAELLRLRSLLFTQGKLAPAVGLNAQV